MQSKERFTVPNLAGRFGMLVINQLSEPNQLRAREWFDRLPFSDNFSLQVALEQAYLHGFLHTITDISPGEIGMRLPSKAELMVSAYQQLSDQARIDLAIEKPFFPDLPDVPDMLKGEEFWLMRRIEGLVWPTHPSFGIPEVWYDKKGVHKGYEYEVSRQLYPDRTDHDLYDALSELSKQVADEKVEVTNHEAVDLLRFLGYQNEEEFITNTESQLKINIGKFGGNVRRLERFMQFAKMTDSLRPNGGKRKTGEKYYCHYLSSAWLLLTMYADGFSSYSPEDIAHAIEDIEMMFIHDLDEDFEVTFKKGTGNTYILRVNGLEEELTISYDQYLILQAITKKEWDDGSYWLQQINDIHDTRSKSPQRDQDLRRRASLDKIADRLSNFATMPFTGETYVETIRKLDETYHSMSQLLRVGFISGLPPYKAIDRTLDLNSKGIFDAILFGLPEMARMEKRLLLTKFGIKFLDKIYTLEDPLAKRIGQVISDEMNKVPLHPGTVSPWGRRLYELTRAYDLKPDYLREVFPAYQLENCSGLIWFARQKDQERNGHLPWTFQDFIPYIKSLKDFNHAFVHSRGVIPGGGDDLYLPRDYASRIEIEIRQLVGKIEQ